jgi:hypothetical protein
MCISAEASFIVGAVLLPAGVYCVRAALRKNRSFLALAMVPLFFSVQQFCEGVVWLGLGQPDEARSQQAALGFLFFALAFWPFWIPLSALFLETHRTRKWLIGVITLLSITWGLVLYYPIAADPQRWLTVQVVHHSVQYNYFGLPVYRVVSPAWLRFFYLATIAVPVGICTNRQGFTFGLLLAASAVVSHFVFAHAFVSVWCFFAALLTLYLCLVFHRLPVSPLPQTP